MAFILTVRGIIYHEGKIFTQKLKNYSKEFAYLPGGKVDQGENLEAALIRELEEECGVQARIGRLLYINQYTDGTDTVIAFMYSVLNPEDFQNIDLQKTSHGHIEVSEFGFSDRKSTPILPSSIRTLDLETYLSRDMPVFIDDENAS